MTSLLSKANEALNQQKDLVNPRWYPRYHLAPPAGWMNDPNGLSGLMVTTMRSISTIRGSRSGDQCTGVMRAAATW